MDPLELTVEESETWSSQHRRSRRTLSKKDLNLIDIDLPLPKCLLCRDSVRVTRHCRISDRENVYPNWNASCAESLREFLNLDVSFQDPLTKADYCQECLCIVRDIDFILKAIKSLRRRLKNYRPSVESYLRNNHLWVQLEYGDKLSNLDIASFSPYDHLVHSICQATSLIDVDGETKVSTSDLLSERISHQTIAETAVSFRENSPENVVFKSEIEDDEPDNDFDPDFRDPLSNIDVDDDSDWTASDAGPRREARKPRGRQVKKVRKDTTKTADRRTVSVSKTKTEKPVLICPTCNMTFLHRMRFHNHIRQHERNATRVAFRCSTCNKKYLQREEQEYHAHVELHQIKFNEQSNLSCVIHNCDKVCVNNLDLKRHVLEEHEDSSTTKCDLCGLICSNPTSLKRHKSDMHGEGEKNPSFKCQQLNCSYHATCLADLKHHNFKHTTEKSFVCTVCDKKFSWRNSMRNHMKRHEVEKKFKCSFANCDKAFSIGESLRRHENSVHCTIRNFLCTSCPKAFKSDKSLQQHIRFLHLEIRRSGLMAQPKQNNTDTQSECTQGETAESDTGSQKNNAQGYEINSSKSIYNSDMLYHSADIFEMNQN